jgi:Na+/melibiose symporter-like transporter
METLAFFHFTDLSFSLIAPVSIETALPVAAADGLGWGPVAISTVLGGTSFVIFFCMMLTIFLSDKVSDLAMVAFGNFMWILGGGGMYLLWKRDAKVWHYVLPVVLAISGFPFISAANRSNFTKAVCDKPELEGSQALMQSVLSMAASVAGFV